MQNIRNFNHLYIARFEASSKYVIIKCCLIKHCYTKNLSLQILKNYKMLLHILDTILVHCILHILGTILVHCLI